MFRSHSSLAVCRLSDETLKTIVNVNCHAVFVGRCFTTDLNSENVDTHYGTCVCVSRYNVNGMYSTGLRPYIAALNIYIYTTVIRSSGKTARPYG